MNTWFWTNTLHFLNFNFLTAKWRYSEQKRPPVKNAGLADWGLGSPKWMEYRSGQPFPPPGEDPGIEPGFPRCWRFFTVERLGKPLLYIIRCYVPNRAATWLQLAV